MIEAGKSVDVLPDFFVARMENMGAVLVNLNAFNLFRIDVAGDVATFFYDETALAALRGFVSKYSTEQAGTDNQIIVFHD